MNSSRRNKLTFDLIFIDGLHNAAQVERAIGNSLKVLHKGGTILVHDCNPTSAEQQTVPTTASPGGLEGRRVESLGQAKGHPP